MHISFYLIGLILYLWTTGFKKIHEAALAHKQSLELRHAVYNVIYTLNEEEFRSGIQSAILLAARRGNSEFIVEAKVHFPLVWTVDPDEGRSLLFLAVQFRQAKVFNLIHEFALKHVFANLRDVRGNYLLHMVEEMVKHI